MKRWGVVWRPQLQEEGQGGVLFTSSLQGGDGGACKLLGWLLDDIIFGSTKKSLCTEFEKMMHKKFQMSSMGELTFFLGLQTVITPMETQKLLLKDEDVCACARYQVNPKVLHLHVVKRNFRYLKGQLKLGLWYPKDSPFDLVAYTDSDYAGASLDRNSTTRDLLTKAFDNGIGVNAGDSKLMLLGKVNAARHKLTTAGENSGYLQGVNYNGKVVTRRVDGKKIIVTEASIRSDLQLMTRKVASDDLPVALSYTGYLVVLQYLIIKPMNFTGIIVTFYAMFFKRPNSVMSDSDESRVTYTGASSPFKDLSDIRSPRADDHEYLELPGMPEGPYVEAALQAPPSPDYVSGLKEPEQAPPSPDYVQGPEHADDEIVIKDQPYAEDASPTAQSPDYVPESDPEVNLEENDDEDPEEDPVDYPADGGDDRDDEDKPSKEDEDDDVDMEANEDEEEEEHPAPVDSVVVALPTTDQAPSAEETESFETDESVATPPPHPAHRVTARIYIPAPIPTPVWSDVEVARLLAISTPPSSPLSPWSSPLPKYLPHHYHYYHPHLFEAASTSHYLPLPPPLPISIPTSSPPLILPSASRREDIPKVTLPPRK
ncbi:hypothetical protein Tco_1038646, partial [Tanacetum coccineum]